MTFGELFQVFMKKYSCKEKRTWIQDERKYNTHLRHLADRRLSSITTDELSELNDKIGADHSYLANRVLELVKVMFNFARGTVTQKGRTRKFPVLWTGTNPAVGIGSFKEHKRQRFIDADELPKFFAALAEASPTIHDYILVSLWTGARMGNVLAMLWSENPLVAERVIAFRNEHSPDAVVVDGDGLGAGVVDQLQHRGYSKGLFEFHGGERPRDFNMYFNSRSEIWGLMRDWFHNESVEIPDDPELKVDLTGPEYGFSSKNQIQLERKEDMKRRGLASPDLGDCLAMTFSVDIAFRSQRPSQLVYHFPGPDAWMA